MKTIYAISILAAASTLAGAQKTAPGPSGLQSLESVLGQSLIPGAEGSGFDGSIPSEQGAGAVAGVRSAPSDVPKNQKSPAMGNRATIEPPPPFPHCALPQQDCRSGLWTGMLKGGKEGATLGFYGVLYPAVTLLSEGFGREMSRHYDGSRSDNGNGRLYTAGGIVLGVLLYIPALAAAAAGGVIGGGAGAVAETVSPGATQTWDVERSLFD